MPGGIGRFASRRNTSQSSQEVEKQKESNANDSKEQKSEVSNDENSNIFASFGERPMTSESAEFNFNMPFAGFDSGMDVDMHDAELEDYGNFEATEVSFDEHHVPPSFEVEMHKSSFPSQQANNSAGYTELERNSTKNVINETNASGESENADNSEERPNRIEPKQGLNLFSRFKKKKESQQQNALNHNNAHENSSTVLINKSIGERGNPDRLQKASLEGVENPELDEHTHNSEAILPENDQSQISDQNGSIPKSTRDFHYPQSDLGEPLGSVSKENGADITVVENLNTPATSVMIEDPGLNHRRKDIDGNERNLEENVVLQDGSKTDNTMDITGATELMTREAAIDSEPKVSLPPEVSIEINNDPILSNKKINPVDQHGNIDVSKENEKLSTEQQLPSYDLNVSLSSFPHRERAAPPENLPSKNPSASLNEEDIDAKKGEPETGVHSTSSSSAAEDCFLVQTHSQPLSPLLSKVVDADRLESSRNVAINDNTNGKNLGATSPTDTSKSSLAFTGLEPMGNDSHRENVIQKHAETEACLLSNSEQASNSSNNGDDISLQQVSVLFSEDHHEGSTGDSFLQGVSTSAEANVENNIQFQSQAPMKKSCTYYIPETTKHGYVDSVNDKSANVLRRKPEIRNNSHEIPSNAIESGGDSIGGISSRPDFTATRMFDSGRRNQKHTPLGQQDSRKVISPSFGKTSSHDKPHKLHSPLRGARSSQKRKVSWSPSTLSRENTSLVEEDNPLAQLQNDIKLNKISVRSQVTSTPPSKYIANEESSPIIQTTPATSLKKQNVLNRETPIDRNKLSSVTGHLRTLHTSNETKVLADKQLVTPSPSHFPFQNKATLRLPDMTPKRLIPNDLGENQGLKTGFKGLDKDEELRNRFKNGAFRASSEQSTGNVTKKQNVAYHAQGASKIDDMIEESFNTNTSELFNSLSSENRMKQYNHEEVYDKMPFDDLLSKLQLDITQSNDILDKNENELIDLRVKLCVAENIALRYQCSIDGILGDIETVLDEVSLDD